MKVFKHCSLFLLSILFLLALPLLSSNHAFADTGWQIVYSPSPSNSTNPSTHYNFLQSVSSYDASHAWAVGSYRNSDGSLHALIEHWNGTNWATQSGVINPGANGNALYGVKALSATNIWAVGSYVDDNFNQQALIEHSTDGGQTWIQDTDSYSGGSVLYGIDGDPSTGDAWAVGYNGNINTLTLQLVNGHFSQQLNICQNSAQNTDILLYSVSEQSSSNVWAVGWRHSSFGGVEADTMQYDGSCWTEYSSSNFSPTNVNQLLGVTAIGSNNVWAVGIYYNSPTISGTLVHWNGSAWSTPINTGYELNSIASNATNNIWAVGSNDGAAPLIYHSSDGGSNWEQTTTDGTATFNGITFDKNSGIGWTVGAGANSNSLTDTLIEHYVSTPQAFLELPFCYLNNKSNTNCKGTENLPFDTAAQEINSYFDHTYPLLSLHAEPSSFQHQVTTYNNESGGDGTGGTVFRFAYSSHDGYDFGAPDGVNFKDPVLAAASGTAKYYSGCNGSTCGLGNHIVITHANGYETIYGHILSDSWIATMSGQQAEVTQGELIGHVGDTGNCRDGNLVYNTPTCAHIHFGVNNASNSTYPEIGVTDPFGWEPAKDALSQSKDTDPWEHFGQDFPTGYTYSSQQITGNKSDYLWQQPLGSMLGNYIDQSGGTATLSAVTIDIPSNVLPSSATLTAVSTPFTSATVNGTLLRSVLPVLDAKLYDLFGSAITTLSNSYTMTIDFSNAILQTVRPGTLSIYSSSDGVSWTKETTTIDTTNKKASAQINHFTQFALMGEADTTAPTTTASLSGTQGQSATAYLSDVTVTFNATDDASGSGVAMTTYRIDGGDWQQYTAPFTVTGDGGHTVDYYSEDTAGNVEAVNAETFTINWYDSNYLYKKQITIDHTKVSGGSNLSNFPVLVSFTDANLKSTGNDGSVQSIHGFDIIFTDSTETTKLDHEIEKYNPATGEIEMWVRIPTLSASTDTNIFMYYDNSSITSSQENKTGVWDSNYKAVWHMGETSGTTNADSTSNGATATKQSSNHPAPLSSGQIAGAQNYNGSSDYQSVSSSSINITGDKTVEMWLNAADFGSATDGTTRKPLLVNIDGTNTYMVVVFDNNNSIQWTVNDGSEHDKVYHNGAGGSASTNTWYHVVGTYTASGSITALYINGTSVADGSPRTGIGIGTTGARIGARVDNKSYFKGYLDEVRISNTVRSTGWITTDYNNQHSPSTFVSEGTATQNPNPPTPLPMYGNYLHRKQLTIDYTKVSGGSNLSNFPALVSLTDSDLKSSGNGGNVQNSSGYDIVFVASDNTTKLDHEIEKYDPTTGTIAMWVRVPTLSASADTKIYLYYDNSAITSSQENTTGIWDTNYKGVYHLGNGSTLSVTDSTSNANNATNHGASASAGQIDGGASFNGTSNYISLPTTGMPTSTMTQEFWMSVPSLDSNHHGLINYGNGSTTGSIQQYYWGPNDDFRLYLNGSYATDKTTINTSTPYHVVLTYDGTTFTWYINGTSVYTKTQSMTASFGNIYVGRSNSGEYFNGTMDEVRISSAARSAGWIGTEYNNQSTPASFYTVGQQQ